MQTFPSSIPSAVPLSSVNDAAAADDDAAADGDAAIEMLRPESHVALMPASEAVESLFICTLKNLHTHTCCSPPLLLLLIKRNTIAERERHRETEASGVKLHGEACE